MLFYSHLIIIREQFDDISACAGYLAQTAQQLREATPWGKGPKYLIRDRDKKYATHFSAVAAGIKELKTPYRTPQRMEFVKGSWAQPAQRMHGSYLDPC
jgi:hypothetical protein